MNWQTSIWKDREELSRAAAADLAQIAEAAVASQGRFALALSGGKTPRRLYEILYTEYREKIDWGRTHLFFGDERYVAQDDPMSNYRMARESLIVPLGIPESNVHPMPTYLDDPDEAAHVYEKTLRSHFGDEAPAFDLVLLGIGLQGHTASLFPGSPALEEKERWVVAVEVSARPPLRLTLTLPAINAGKRVFFLVSGKGKQPIVAKLRDLGPEESRDYPAALVRPQGPVTLYLDQAAQG